MDFLKSAVSAAIAKSSSLPFILGDQVDIEDSLWTLHNATKKDDNSNCSVFTFDINLHKSRLPIGKNAVRKLRTLRHPGVLKVLDTVETESHLYVMTERIQPLAWPVKRNSIAEETAKWGLYAIATTLKFINEHASSVHGAIRLSSVYVSESGEWKLGGFDVLSSMKEDEAVIYNYGSLVPDYARYAPPEVLKGGWDAIRSNPLTAVDSFGMGVLIYQVFNGGTYRGPDDSGKMAHIPRKMQQSYRSLMHANPKTRSSVSNFIDQGKRIGGFFDNPLIHLTEDIDSIGLKSEEEREEFINQLEDLSDDFPEDFFKVKVLPQLLHSVEYGGGGPKVFTATVKIGTKLSEEEYQSKLTPVIVRLFGNPDRAIRISLLENLPLMIDHLPKKVVNDKIFPQMLTGFTDQAPLVREQTVKSVLVVIEKLSDRTINGDLLRYLAKTANDEQPGIRTNTTICLGKIARNLGQSSRTKVLVAAFGRSLRDPFVHARNAGLLALAATIDLFPEDDCATKVLPAVCPALVDKEKLVRDQAHKTLDAYLTRIRKYNETMADTATPDPVASNAGTRIDTSKDSSWAGWAISSFTNRVSLPAGRIEPTANGGLDPQGQPTVAQPPSVPESRVSSPAHGFQSPARRPVTAETPSIASATSKLSLEEPAATANDEFEEWGDMDDGDGDDGWGFDEDKEASAQDRRRQEAASATTRQPPAAPTATARTKTKTTAAASTVSYDDGGEPDFAGWLAAQSKSKASKALPKKTTKTTTASTRLSSSSSRPQTIARSRTEPTAAKQSKIEPKQQLVEEDDDWGAWD